MNVCNLSEKLLHIYSLIRQSFASGQRNDSLDYSDMYDSQFERSMYLKKITK